MHIGILRTDSVRPEWVAEHGQYPDMFARLLTEQDDALRFTTWDVEAGELPVACDVADAFLITGSKSSVYDDKAWIRSLEDFVHTLHATRSKLIGICFGHQLIAQALGGTVAKSNKGWGVGVNTYAVDDSLFRQADGKDLCLLASHQDQVMQMPPGAKKIATNAHCEVAGMVLGKHILTLQGHPEFTPEYARAILSFRHDMIGEERAAEGLKSLVSEKHEGARAARWILDFLRQ